MAKKWLLIRRNPFCLPCVAHSSLARTRAKVAVMRSALKRVRKIWKQLPQLVRFLLLHAAIGIGAGWLLLALLLWTDVNGVGTLIWASDSRVLAVAMLAAGFAITFGGAAAAAAVMMMHFENDGD
jgi:hypothetical protein